MTVLFGPGFPPDHRTLGAFKSREIIRGKAFVPSGVPTDIWPPGGIIDWTQSGQVSIVSTSVEDNPSGAGIGSVHIVSPDQDNVLDPAGETINLNGTTPVVTSGSFLSPLNIMDAASAGSSAPVGVGLGEFDIALAAGTITATIGGAVVAVIDPTSSVGSTGNRSIGAASRAFAPDSSGLTKFTAVINQLIISIRPTASGIGSVTVELFRKRPGEPPLEVANPFGFDTSVPVGTVLSQLSIVLETGDLIYARATESDKDVIVSVEMVVDVFGPIPV